MPDTKIIKVTLGWIDADDPNTYYPVRRLARAARRSKRVTTNTKPLKITAAGRQTTNLTIVGTRDANTGASTGQTSLTPLQDKLYTRLTTKQGVSFDDALAIVTTYTYNKAASYGHMRAAGATHAEAEIVINLDNPAISLAYGKAREAGDSHTNALSNALSVN